MTRNVITDSNEEQLLIVVAGTEAVKGTAVAPTFKLYPDIGAFSLVTDEGLVSKRKATGTYFGRKSPSKAQMTVSGAYAQELTFEDSAILPRYSVVGGGAGVTDGDSPPAYTYARRPSPNRKNWDTLTLEHGFPGLPFQAEMVCFPEFTIAGDMTNADNVWMFNGVLWARINDPKATTTITDATSGTVTTIVKTGVGWTVNAFTGAFVVATGGTAGNLGKFARILSNTADTLTLEAPGLPNAVVAGDDFVISGAFTQGIADRTTETIPVAGTRLFLANAAETLGDAATEVLDALISFSVTYQSNIAGKRFTNNTRGYGKKLGKGETVVTGQLRLEFDSRRELDKWISKEIEKIRIQSPNGTLIHDTPDTFKTFRIDVFDARYDTFTEDTLENNRTATASFVSQLDATEANIVEFRTILPNATMP